MFSRNRCLIAALAVALVPLARAQNPLPVPASLLVHPEYDNTVGRNTLITITNTNVDPMSGPIRVEFVYLSSECLEFNRTEVLTPGDTTTVLSSFHNPQMNRGYLYMFAKTNIQAAISFNHLISTATIIDGIATLQYTVEPFVFRAIDAEGTPTDVDGDLRRDLNGIEYEQAPDELVFPRFHGQGDPSSPSSAGPAASELVLVNLTGANQFSSVVSMFLFNDNRQQISTQFQFDCWAKVALTDISGAFANDFLADSTNHDPDEPIGAPGFENGWMRLDGTVALSPVCTVLDPAVLGFLVEKVGGSNATATLPFIHGRQANGTLRDFADTIDGCTLLADGDRE